MLTAIQFISVERRAEGFSELAVLGPNMRAADYPREVFVGQQFSLYLYVINREGEVTFYKILVKTGNKSSFVNSTAPMNAPVVAEYDKILMNDQTWTRPIILSINKTESNIRLVFEMWTYNDATDGFVYEGRWNQLWLNVSAQEVP
jgi:uncharacterized membrane protein